MATVAPHPAALWEVLEETRGRTLELIDGLAAGDLTGTVTPLLSPLVWDLGHIGNFEQRWLLGDESELDGVYNPFENPRATRAKLPVLEPRQCFDYMAAVRERVASAIDGCDPFVVELVIQHEQQHNETMLQLLRMLGDYDPSWVTSPPQEKGSATPGAVADWVELPEGIYEIGTEPRGDGSFHYDNECRSYHVHLLAAEIARRPVTKGEYRAWIEAGGYGRDEWWSDAGRAWRDEQRAEAPLSWERDGAGGFVERQGAALEPLVEDAPVVHVSWFEADAFARAHGARLPSEFEWEVAATFDPASGGHDVYPWGDDAWREDRAVLDQHTFGSAPLSAACAASPLGCEHMLGQVWEWTASEFRAYPGFEPFRYREYSEPFFDGRFRVLRGGSWATRPRTVTARFRNWDLPQRRQIFSGLRLARDA